MIFIKNIFNKKNKNKTIWYVGGKSGGHIIPLIGILRKNKALFNHRSIFLTGKSKTDFTVIQNVKQEEIDCHIYLNLQNYPKNIFETIKYIPFLLFSILKTIYFFYKYSPNEIYTTGGYIAVIPSLFAKLFNVPIKLYHLDSILGRAGKFINKYADEIYIFFDDVEKCLNKTDKIIKSENIPIRFSSKDLLEKNYAKQLLAININKFVIFILGGSQGSIQLNECFINALKKTSDKFRNKLFILHQIGGEEDINKINNIYKSLNIDVNIFNYEWHLEKFYNASDLIISRAGSICISEIIFFNKQAILIPLQGEADDHQVKNAEYFCKKYDFINIIKDKENQKITDSIINFLNNYNND